MGTNLFGEQLEITSPPFVHNYEYEKFRTKKGLTYPKVFVAAVCTIDLKYSGIEDWGDGYDVGDTIGYEVQLAFVASKNKHQKLCEVFEFRTGEHIGTYHLAATPKDVYKQYFKDKDEKEMADYWMTNTALNSDSRIKLILLSPEWEATKKWLKRTIEQAQEKLENMIREEHKITPTNHG